MYYLLLANGTFATYECGEVSVTASQLNIETAEERSLRLDRAKEREQELKRRYQRYLAATGRS